MSNGILDILIRNFPEQEFEHEQIKYGGIINAIFIKSNSEELLENTWEKIRNMIGVYFQTKLKTEFEVWNLYLFFISPIAISKGLKYHIEHDTVSSRKIVIDEHKMLGTDNFKKILFEEHITNDNLKIKVSKTVNSSFSKSLKLASIVEKFDLIKAKPIKEDYIGDILDKLETSIRNEI